MHRARYSRTATEMTILETANKLFGLDLESGPVIHSSLPENARFRSQNYYQNNFSVTSVFVRGSGGGGT